MREKKCVIKAFRSNDNDYVDYPKKISNVRVARLFYGDQRGCSRCFPHGFKQIMPQCLKIEETGSFIGDTNGGRVVN